MSTCMIGHLMALSAWRQLPAQQGPFNRYFQRAMLYAILVWVPVTGYFYYAWSDWSWVYLLEPQRLPAIVGPMVLATYVAGMFLGFLCAQHLIRERRAGAALASLVAVVTFFVGLLALTSDQYAHLGTREEYLAGKAAPIMQNTAFMLRLNIAGAILALGAGAVIVRNLLEGRAASRGSP